MTSVFYREYYDNLIFSVEGHSGFANTGSDIVCAGVSVLSYTLLNTLLDEEAGENIKLVKNIVSDGYLYLEIEFFDYSKERIKAVADTILTGFYMLEENYPDYVKIV